MGFFFQVLVVQFPQNTQVYELKYLEIAFEQSTKEISDAPFFRILDLDTISRLHWCTSLKPGTGLTI